MVKKSSLKIKAHFQNVPPERQHGAQIVSLSSVQQKRQKGFGASVISWMLLKPFRQTRFHLDVAISQRNNFV